MSRRLQLAMLLVVLTVSGCVFVQPTAEGKKVRLLTTAEVVDRCRALGNITSVVADRVGAIVRSEEAVLDDVVQNAKNAAAEMGGDTIVPVSRLEEGKQTFGVYRCLSP